MAPSTGSRWTDPEVPRLFESRSGFVTRVNWGLTGGARKSGGKSRKVDRYCCQARLVSAINPDIASNARGRSRGFLELDAQAKSLLVEHRS